MAARLSVNVDHVATLRQARRAGYPDPVAAALLAESAGASGITVHLRGDRRHIQDEDVERLRHAIRGKLNLEMAATAEMLEIAERLRPHQVTLVPERPEEVTTEGGLDLVGHSRAVRAATERLRAHGIEVSVFVDPAPEQLARLTDLGGAATGFEINTDAYTRGGELDRELHLAGMHAAAEQGHELGLRVYAGHGLTTDNVGPVAALPFMEELNIGHSLVARSVMVGMAQAVREMLAAIGGG
jgi:pyridoxine 5-phosphate synthase